MVPQVLKELIFLELVNVASMRKVQLGAIDKCIV